MLHKLICTSEHPGSTAALPSHNSQQKEIGMSYLDLLVITDPGSARTAQEWSENTGRKKKSPHRTRSAFQLRLKKMQTMEYFSLYLARDDISTIWSEERRHLLENPAACYTSRVVFFSGSWEQTFPQRRLVTNELRALTPAELAELDPLLSAQAAWIWEQTGERGFSLPASKRSWWEMQFGSWRGKAERGISARHSGGELSSGKVSVPISWSLWSFSSLFLAFPLCYIREKLTLRATAHLQQIWRGQVTEEWGHHGEVSGEKGSLQERQDTRNSCHLLTPTIPGGSAVF